MQGESAVVTVCVYYFIILVKKILLIYLKTFFLTRSRMSMYIHAHHADVYIYTTRYYI